MTSRYLDDTMCAAARAGDVEKVIAGLGQPVDLGRRSYPAGDTLLHIAASHGHLALAERLLEIGADPDPFSWPQNIGAECTPLYCAAERGDVSMARLLLGHGANPNLAGNMRLGPPLEGAASHERVELVDLLLDSGAQPSGSGGSWSPLHGAAVSGSVASMQVLLKRGAQVDARARWHRVDDDLADATPLHVAVCRGHVACVRALLERRADPNATAALVNPYTNKVWASATPLGLAVDDAAPPEIIDLLLASGAKPKGVVHAAARRGNLRVIAAAVSDHVNLDTTEIVHCRDNTLVDRGETALHIAVQEGHADVVDLLLTAGANPRTVAWDNRTPIRDARTRGKEDVEHLLIACGVAQVKWPLVTLACLTLAVALGLVGRALAPADPSTLSRWFLAIPLGAALCGGVLFVLGSKLRDRRIPWREYLYYLPDDLHDAWRSLSFDDRILFALIALAAGVGWWLVWLLTDWIAGLIGAGSVQQVQAAVEFSGLLLIAVITGMVAIASVLKRGYVRLGSQ